MGLGLFISVEIAVKNSLIRGKALITGAENKATQPAAVLIGNGRIEAVGAEAQSRAAEADEVIECKGQTLLPGLIDCHNHLSLDPALDNYLLRMNDSIPELTIRAVQTMAVDLASGVTTSRCLGDKGFLDIECKKAVAAGQVSGPRLLVATRGIRAPHGHGFVGYPFCGIENIRQAVRENLSAGADLIKIYITGTLRSSKGFAHFFSREEVQTLVDEAHRVGAPVATHCIGGPGFKLALETGIDVIEHGYFISDADIDLLIQSGRWLVMTPSIFFTDARIRTLPANLIEGHIQQRNEVRQRLTAAIHSGVKFAVGTDGMHGGLAREVQYLTQFGASPFEAIKAATLNAAAVCDMTDSIGSIEKGKIADIIGVAGNPLEDISALQRVKTVVQEGLVVKRSE
jgi:imidazolonepropionase-like amidohydrolase